MKSSVTSAYSPRYGRAIAFACLLLLGIGVLLVRNTDPILNPVMYTEDGQWLGLALSDGWANAFWNAKEGYLVWGNILLLGLAYLGSLGVCGDGLLCLPQAISIASYLFFSTVAAVAWVATEEEVPIAYRYLLWLTLVLLPLGDSSNEIIGRLSNIGYLAVFLAFLLVHMKETKRAPALAVDIGLMFCAATNPVCILAIPMLLGLTTITQSGRGKAELLFEALKKNALLWTGLAAIAAVTVIRGIGAKGSGVTGALELSSLVEVALARSIIYPLTFPIYHHLTDLSTVLLSGALVSGLAYGYWRLAPNDPIVKLVRSGTVAFMLFWLFTLYMRQSLTQQLGDYRTTFPDRYFMGLNIFVLFIVVSIASSASRWPASVMGNKSVATRYSIPRLSSVLPFCAIAGLYLLSLPWLLEGKAPRMKIALRGDFTAGLCTAAPQLQGDVKFINLPIYFEGWTMRLPAGLARETIKKLSCPDPFADFFISDSNWEKGVARNWAGFFVPNSQPFQSLYLPGAIVTFANGEKRRVLRTESSGAYLNIYVDGSPLDAKLAGIPSQYSITGTQAGNTFQ